MAGGLGRWHGRELKAPGEALAGARGRELFAAALEEGGAEAFFPLCGAFETQAEPAFCGLGALTSVLNALGVDPGRPWLSPASGSQTVWRWFGDTMLDCCKPLDEVRQQGLTLDEVACLARCNGADVRLERGRSLLAFREAVKAACGGQGPGLTRAEDRREFMIVSYHRGTLNQTGTGHFAPVAAYAPRGAGSSNEDMVLLFDVAKFKYPPHWVPLSVLHEAMQERDPETGHPRGYLLLQQRGGGQGGALLSLNLPQAEAALIFAKSMQTELTTLWARNLEAQGTPRLQDTEASCAFLGEVAREVRRAELGEASGFRAASCLTLHAPATGFSFLKNLRETTFYKSVSIAVNMAGTVKDSPTCTHQVGELFSREGKGNEAEGCTDEIERAEEPSVCGRCSARALTETEARVVLILASLASNVVDEDTGRRPQSVDQPQVPKQTGGSIFDEGPWREFDDWWNTPPDVVREVGHIAAQLRAFAKRAMCA